MIKKWLLVCLCACSAHLVNAQSFNPYTEVGVFLGTSYYIGDLNENHFELAQPAVGLIYRNNLNRRFALKASAWSGELRGSDKKNVVDTFKINRNLHFRSPIIELSGQVEFNFFEYETGSTRYPFSPFIFAGLSIFKHNPQARRFDTENPYDRDGFGTSNDWIELQSLGTEGQNSFHYPEKEAYSLTQFAIPLGVGIKWSLGQRFSLVAEYGIRKTFTDYLDDVGGTYADPQKLANEDIIAAQLAVRDINTLNRIESWLNQNPLYSISDLYRNGGQLNDGTEVFQNTDKRRADTNEWNDWYTFAGITLSFKILKTPKVCQY